MESKLDIKTLSDLTVFTKYARFQEELGRRETWDELVTRNKEMHLKKFPDIADEIEKAYKYVYDKKVLPSMRSMQFSGKPIEISPNRIYNCGYLPIDDWRAFSEIMFLLLGGCFHEDTEIKTRIGNKKIKDVTVDDYILTFDTKTNKYHWIKPFAVLPTPTEDKEKYELEFDDGTIIKTTHDHKFYTKNRGWIEAKDLQETDDIEFYNEQEIDIIDVSEEDLKKEYPQFF